MKTKLRIISFVSLVFMTTNLFSQKGETLVLWDFRVANTWSTSIDLITSADMTYASPDEANDANKGCEFFTEEGANRTSIKGQNGYAFSTNWHSALGTTDQTYPKWWVIKNICTNGYFNLSFQCDLWSSNSGPRDYIIEYQIGSYDGTSNAELTWKSVNTSPLITNATQTKYTFPLPAECAGKTSVSIRVRRATTLQCSGIGEIGSGGQGRIDNIWVSGYKEPTEPTLYSSVSEHTFCEVAVESTSTYDITIQGKQLSPANAVISLNVSTPFSVSKTTVNAVFGQLPETTVTLSFSPSETGEFNEQLCLTGGGAPDKIIHLRGVANGYQPSDVPSLRANPYRISIQGNYLSISELTGESVDVYTIAGLHIYQTHGKSGELLIPIAKRGCYLVKVGDSVTKVISAHK